MEAVGVDDPARCVYVGDRLFDDVWGARNAGMRAIHIPHRAIPPEPDGAHRGRAGRRRAPRSPTSRTDRRAGADRLTGSSNFASSCNAKSEVPVPSRKSGKDDQSARSPQTRATLNERTPPFHAHQADCSRVRRRGDARRDGPHPHRSRRTCPGHAKQRRRRTSARAAWFPSARGARGGHGPDHRDVSLKQQQAIEPPHRPAILRAKGTWLSGRRCRVGHCSGLRPRDGRQERWRQRHRQPDHPADHGAEHHLRRWRVAPPPPNTGFSFTLAGTDRYFNDQWHKDKQSATTARPPARAGRTR